MPVATSCSTSRCFGEKTKQGPAPAPRVLGAPTLCPGGLPRDWRQPHPSGGPPGTARWGLWARLRVLPQERGAQPILLLFSITGDPVRGGGCGVPR